MVFAWYLFGGFPRHRHPTRKAETGGFWMGFENAANLEVAEGSEIPQSTDKDKDIRWKKLLAATNILSILCLWNSTRNKQIMETPGK